MKLSNLIKLPLAFVLSIALGIGTAFVPVSVQEANAENRSSRDSDDDDEDRSNNLTSAQITHCKNRANAESGTTDETKIKWLDAYDKCEDSKLNVKNSRGDDASSAIAQCRTAQAEVSTKRNSFTAACGKGSAKCNQWAKSCLGTEGNSRIPEKIQEAYLANKEIKELDEKALELQEQLTEQEGAGKEIQTAIDEAERANAAAKANLDDQEKQTREKITDDYTQAAAQLQSQMTKAQSEIAAKIQQRKLQKIAFDYSREVDCKKQRDVEVETQAAKIKVAKCKGASQCIGKAGKYRQRLIDFGAQSLKNCQFRVSTQEQQSNLTIDGEIATLTQARQEAQTQLNGLSEKAKKAAERALSEITRLRQNAHDGYLNKIRPLSAQLEKASKKYSLLQQKAQKLAQQIAAQKEILDQIKESNSLASEDLESGDILGSDVDSREFSSTSEKYADYGDKFTAAVQDYDAALESAKNACCATSGTEVDPMACNSIKNSLSALGKEDATVPSPPTERVTASAPADGDEAEPVAAAPTSPRPAAPARTPPTTPQSTLRTSR